MSTINKGFYDCLEEAIEPLYSVLQRYCQDYKKLQQFEKEPVDVSYSLLDVQSPEVADIRNLSSRASFKFSRGLVLVNVLISSSVSVIAPTSSCCDLMFRTLNYQRAVIDSVVYTLENLNNLFKNVEGHIIKYVIVFGAGKRNVLFKNGECKISLRMCL